MNQKDMNAFLAEQALLLASNSVSLTQISRPQQLTTKQHQSQQNQVTAAAMAAAALNIPSPTATMQQPQFASEYSLATSQPVGNTSSSAASNLSKYSQLLLVLEEMGKDIRPTYSGSRSSAERLKRTIVHARILVRECLLETERQNNATSRP